MGRGRGLIYTDAESLLLTEGDVCVNLITCGRTSPSKFSTQTTFFSFIVFLNVPKYKNGYWFFTVVSLNVFVKRLKKLGKRILKGIMIEVFLYV